MQSGSTARKPTDDPVRLRAEREARKQAQAELKSQREKLTGGPANRPQFQYDLLCMFARNELGAAITMPALSVIFSIAAMFWAPWPQAIMWLTIVIFSKVMLLELARRFLATPEANVDIRVWRWRFICAELINGLSWAGFAMVGFGGILSVFTGGSVTMPDASDTFSSHVFIFATLIVLLAVRMSFCSTILPVLHAGTIPMTMAVTARLILLDDPFYLALATMAVGVHVYFIFLARGLNATALQMLQFRAQKDLLIAALEEEKSISDEARRRAEAANKAKSRFLATMSHELRTPLNAVMGFSEVMKDEVFGPLANPTYKEYAGNIHHSGSHLLNLINEILDLSRIEAGRYDLHEEAIRIADVAEDCHRLLKLRADSKGLTIVENFQPGLGQVWADQRAIRQIILNLMSNALKFTPTGGTITITIAMTPDGGQFLAVRDSGPGIPAEEIPKVLEAFGQGSLAHQTAEGGTGLGLPIVQSLIKLHGGTFDLQSQLRRGTQATITLPPKRTMQKVAPLQPLGRERHRGEPDPTAKPEPSYMQAAQTARKSRLVSDRRPVATAR